MCVFLACQISVWHRFCLKPTLFLSIQIEGLYFEGRPGQDRRRTCRQCSNKYIINIDIIIEITNALFIGSRNVKSGVCAQ